MGAAAPAACAAWPPATRRAPECWCAPHPTRRCLNFSSVSSPPPAPPRPTGTCPWSATRTS
eukprot:scaffold12024_cov142-Isochrysis_galbana.AAC.2